MNSKEVLLLLMQASLFTPYKWGGNHPLEGVDCSGFVLELLRSIGRWDKSDSTAQGIHAKLSRDNEIDIAKVKFGDLLFFGKGRLGITHISMALSPLLMIEAGGGGSHTQSAADAIKHGAMVRIRPIASRNDLVSTVALGIGG